MSAFDARPDGRACAERSGERRSRATGSLMSAFQSIRTEPGMCPSGVVRRRVVVDLRDADVRVVEMVGDPGRSRPALRGARTSSWRIPPAAPRPRAIYRERRAHLAQQSAECVRSNGVEWLAPIRADPASGAARSTPRPSPGRTRAWRARRGSESVVPLQVHLAVDDRPAGGEAVLQRPGRLREVDPRRKARDDGRRLVVPAGLGADPDAGASRGRGRRGSRRTRCSPSMRCFLPTPPAGGGGTRTKERNPTAAGGRGDAGVRSERGVEGHHANP